MKITRGGSGTNRDPAEWFTGDVFFSNVAQVVVGRFGIRRRGTST